jgi:hypothetical protein
LDRICCRDWLVIHYHRFGLSCHLLEIRRSQNKRKLGLSYILLLKSEDCDQGWNSKPLKSTFYVSEEEIHEQLNVICCGIPNGHHDKWKPGSSATPPW